MIKVKTGYVGCNHIWKSDGEYKYLEIDEWRNINRDIFNGPVFDEVIEGKRLVNCSHFHRYRFLLNKNTEVFKVIDDEFIKIIENGRIIVTKEYMYDCDRITHPYYYDANTIVIQNYHSLWIKDVDNYVRIVISLVFDTINKKIKVVLNELEEEIDKEVFYDDIENTEKEIREINKELDKEINNSEYIKNLKLNEIFKRVDYWMKVIIPNGDIKIFELKFDKDGNTYSPFGYDETSDLLRALLWYGKKYLNCESCRCLYELSNSMKDIKFEDIITYYRAIPIFGIVKDIE